MSLDDLSSPESNRDSFTRLEQAGEIDAALASRLRGWAGFRNILVHEYLAIDHRIAWRAVHGDLADPERSGRWALSKLD